ncbi:MAG: UDP-N-acetylmuramoyl-tripeptide--D-alanyl-D-alanine ligase [Patescibacteria group bacterium]
MKQLFKFCVSFFLGLLARAVVRRYRPKVVMVTGSVGKTSTKDAVASVLVSRFLVRKSEKSFNSEFGVPFTILGVSNPWHDTFAWLTVFRRAFALLFLPNHYPNLLVLEVGSGKPGDLAHILRIVTPDIVVVTCLPEIPVHVETYASPEAVREEEFSPAFALATSAPLIIPIDDPYTLTSARRTSAHVITYGTAPDAVVCVKQGGFFEENKKVLGMKADIEVTSPSIHAGEKGTVVVKGSIGSAQLLPAAAAIAVGLALDISLAESLTALEAYEPPPGRGRLLRGVRNSVLIDDSYNASPAAVEQALATLQIFPHAKRRVAVLGDMLELGRYSIIEHQRIAAVADAAVDLVVAVGIRARAFTALSHHAQVIHFDTARAAAETFPDLVQEGDVILIKGSQSIRTERIVEALLFDPADRALLVRQEKAWKKRG